MSWDKPYHSTHCLAMALAEGPSGHQLKIRHPSQLAVGVRDSDEWGLIESIWRLNIFHRPFVMARALDAGSDDAFTGRTSELRGKEQGYNFLHNILHNFCITFA